MYKVFCLPKNKIQEKALTLGGAIESHKFWTGIIEDKPLSPFKIENKDLEEKAPLGEGDQIRVPYPC